VADSLKWYGDEAKKRITTEMERRLTACAIVVSGHAKKLISVAGTGAGPGQKRRYGSDPSKPGEPPRKQTGHLRRSVAWERAGLVARVGTNVRYGRWLELGTRKMAARPWLRRALAECQAQIQAILSKPMN